MKVTSIFASDLKAAIGTGDKLPWGRFQEELSHFKKTTKGHSILMGRKTYEGLGKPLPDRNVFVLTSDPNKQFKGATTVTSVEEFLELNKEQEEVFIAGGAQVYRLAEPYVTNMIVSVVQAIYSDADVFYQPNGLWIEYENLRKVIKGKQLNCEVMYLEKWE